MSSFSIYISSLRNLLQQLLLEQAENICRAGTLVANALEAGGIIQVFGSGHSHMLAEEAFFRAGGIVPVNPILDQRLSFYEGAVASTLAERQSGYARRILQREQIGSTDVAIVISNSGRNAVSIEMALELKSMGLKSIAITSVKQSKQSVSRHVSGMRLFEVVDIAVDNCVPLGDAIFAVPGSSPSQHMGPTSTVLGAAVINSIMIEAAMEMGRKNIPISVFPSANVGDVDEHVLKKLLADYSKRIRYFRLAPWQL